MQHGSVEGVFLSAEQTFQQVLEALQQDDD